MNVDVAVKIKQKCFITLSYIFCINLGVFKS